MSHVENVVLVSGGKLVGVACAVSGSDISNDYWHFVYKISYLYSGVLVLALPIPIVVENFAAFYDDQKFQQLLQEKKEAHYADILHQYAAEDVALAGLMKTITSNMRHYNERSY